MNRPLVCDMSINTTDKRLFEFISIFGDPINLNIAFNKETNKTNGFALCEFDNKKKKNKRKKKILFRKKHTIFGNLKKNDVIRKRCKNKKKSSRDKFFYVVKYLDKKEKLKFLWQIKQMVIINKLVVEFFFTENPELLKTLFLTELSLNLVSIRFNDRFDSFKKTLKCFKKVQRKNIFYINYRTKNSLNGIYFSEQKRCPKPTFLDQQQQIIIQRVFSLTQIELLQLSHKIQKQIQVVLKEIKKNIERQNVDRKK